MTHGREHGRVKRSRQIYSKGKLNTRFNIWECNTDTHEVGLAESTICRKDSFKDGLYFKTYSISLRFE